MCVRDCVCLLAYVFVFDVCADLCVCYPSEKQKYNVYMSHHPIVGEKMCRCRCSFFIFFICCFNLGEKTCSRE